MSETNGYNESPYDAMPVLNEMQARTMNAARELLEDAGFDIGGMAMIMRFDHEDLGDFPRGENGVCMACFHPVDDWVAHYKLLTDAIKVVEQVAAKDGVDLGQR
jgi:hypothetical protein